MTDEIAAMLPRMKELALERVRFHASVRLGQFSLGSLRIEQVTPFCEHLAHDLVWQLTGEMVEKVHVRDEQISSVRVPATWWEHLKDRWFGQRLKRRWPIRYQNIATQTIRHEHRACPHIDTRFPSDMQHIDWMLADNGKENNCAM